MHIHAQANTKMHAAMHADILLALAKWLLLNQKHYSLTPYHIATVATVQLDTTIVNAVVNKLR